MENGPNFTGYTAKDPGRARGLSPGAAYHYLKINVWYGGVLLPYGMMKHRKLLRTVSRTQSHTYTCFLRGPTQLQTLCGPVMDFLGNPARTGQKVEILLFACSNGAEVYTIASWLMQYLPGLDFHITASDLHQEMVDRCNAADYSAEEALQSEYITPSFVTSTFDRKGDRYVVRPEVKEKATFVQASLLDRPGLEQKFQPADVVIAQNVLFHLVPKDATEAFENIVAFLKPRSALLIEGMEQDLRVELTKRHGLEPLLANHRKIYMETRVHTPADWWNYYWGVEPYLPVRPDRDRRYGTIFLKH